jgi:hypothetical protein
VIEEHERPDTPARSRRQQPLDAEPADVALAPGNDRLDRRVAGGSVQTGSLAVRQLITSLLVERS